MVKQQRKPKSTVPSHAQKPNSGSQRARGAVADEIGGRQSPPRPISENPDSGPVNDTLLSAAYRFLTVAGTMRREPETLAEFVDAIKTVTRCSAVGIRMHTDGGFLAYGAHNGFCDGFMEIEEKISLKHDRCLCTEVFQEQTDESYPFFTASGAFHTNNASNLLMNPELSHLGPLRGTCFSLGYQTMALFPIRSHDKILGLIHIADPRPDGLPPEMVRLMEKAALLLGASIEKVRALEALEQTRANLEWRIQQRTAELVTANEQLTEQVRQRTVAEQQLAHNQGLLQRVFDGITDPLVLLDRQMHVQMMNDAAIRYYDVQNSEIALNKACYESLGRFRDPCQTCRIPTAVKEGRHMAFERKGFLHCDRDEHVVVYPLTGSLGEPRGAVMRIHDVTDNVAMRQQVDQIHKQAALGMLVSSVAHEIKNPNSLIAFNISILKDYFRDMLPILDLYAQENSDLEICRLPYSEFRTDVFKLLETMEHGTQRIDAFLANLKELKEEKSKVEFKKTALKMVIEKVLAMVSTKIESSVHRFEVEVPRTLPEIDTDPVVLSQVIVNLLVNAVQAADKGLSWIRLRVEPFGAQQQAVIHVEDNGRGMDGQTQKRIFEPFYSTKVAEGGTGLGLFVCRNLVHELGGRLMVASEPGKGSCFTLELPMHGGKDRIADDSQPPELASAHPSSVPPPTPTPEP